MGKSNALQFAVAVVLCVAGLHAVAADGEVAPGAPVESAAAISDVKPPPLMMDPPKRFYVDWWEKHLAAPADANAAKFYVRASRAYVDDKAARVIVAKDPFAWDEAEGKQVAAWVQRNTEALVLLDRGSRLRQCYFDVSDSMPVEGVENDSRFNQRSFEGLRRCALARGKSAVRAGRFDQAVADATMLLRLAHQAERQRLVLYYLVGLRYRQHSYGLLALAMQHANAVDWLNIAQRVNEADPLITSPQEALIGEDVCFRQLISHGARDDDGDGRIERIEIPEAPGVRLTVPMTIAEVEQELVHIVGTWRKLYGLPFDAFEREFAAATGIDFENGTIREVAFPKSAFAYVFRNAKYTEYARNWTRSMLALHAYRQQHGRWPEKLADALGGRAELMHDPYGDVLKYRLVDGEPCVYSPRGGLGLELFDMPPPGWTPPACAKPFEAPEVAKRAREKAAREKAMKNMWGDPNQLFSDPNWAD